MPTNCAAPLSLDELSEFYQYIGRTIDTAYIKPDAARNALNVWYSAQARGRRYTQRVWAKYSRSDYINREAAACADFAAGLPFPTLERTYLLPDRGGRETRQMGHVYFRLCEFSPSLIGLEPTDENRKAFPTIESIELHPSLRQHGFLKTLLREMKSRGFLAVAIGNIANPSWAYHLYKQSISSEKIVLLSSAKSVEFGTRVSPVPTFAIKL